MEIKDVYKARNLLKGVIKDTPINYVLNLIPDSEVYVKLESLQHTGSFKLRGAYNKIHSLTKEQKERGIIGASAGNHAQGVAYAAKILNINAQVVMPQTAPLAKIDATRSYGAEVILSGNNFDEAYQKSKIFQKENNRVFIEPFNDEYVIAGQGTIALEILEKIPDIDAIFVPIGGGGLAGGIAFTIKTLAPHVKVYGVEASSANSMSLSLESNKIVQSQQITTIADGIAVKMPGDLTFDLCRKYLDRIILVDDIEIASAMLLLIENIKAVSEGAGATSLAGALKIQKELKGKKICCLISGGNIDVTFLSKMIDNALKHQGRKFIFTTTILDKPGALATLIDIVSKTGANIVSVSHDRLKYEIDFNKCQVEISLETFNRQHILDIIKKLQEKGYQINEEECN